MTSPGLYTADPDEDVTAELERRVVEINKAFAGWIIASWEMCPTHVWTGAAQEYCNKIEKLMREIQKGGSDLPASSPNTIARASPMSAKKASPPPFATTTTTNALNSFSPNAKLPAATPPAPISFGTGFTKPQMTSPVATSCKPSGGVTAAGFASPIVPSPIPCESPNKSQFCSIQVPQQPAPISSSSVVPAAPVSNSSRKRRATEDPEGAPNAHNPLKQVLNAAMLSSKAKMQSGGFGFGKGATQTAPKDKERGKVQPNGSESGSSARTAAPAPIPKPPLFGSLLSASGNSAIGGNASASDPGRASSAAAATETPSSEKPFAALFGNAGAGAQSKFPQFGAASSAAVASSPSTCGASGFGGFGGSSSKPDNKVAASFSFGSGASTPGFGAGAAFGGGVMASVSTPTFGTLGPAPTGVSIAATAGAPAAAAAAADDEGAEKEPFQKVELKGDDKTDIQFSGKTTFRFNVSGKWTDGTLGALTIRKDKASGTSWLQVNNESKGNILLYGAFIKSASVSITEAKSTIMVSLNVFKFPPGKEPNKTVDDGSGGRKMLPEKEENPVSAKTTMFKVKAENLTPLVDALEAVGIKCTKK